MEVAILIGDIPSGLDPPSSPCCPGDAEVRAQLEDGLTWICGDRSGQRRDSGLLPFHTQAEESALTFIYPLVWRAARPEKLTRGCKWHVASRSKATRAPVSTDTALGTLEAVRVVKLCLWSLKACTQLVPYSGRLNLALGILRLAEP